MAEQKKVLMVVAPTNFKDEEYFLTKETLEKHGIKVETASLTSEVFSVKGEKLSSVLLLKDATSDYDAIVFVGGPGAEVYFKDKTAHSLAKKAFTEGKVVAAICISPSILANAGLLKGKQATCFPSENSSLRSKGVILRVEGVVRDGKIITAKDPSFSKKFGEAIAETL